MYSRLIIFTNNLTFKMAGPNLQLIYSLCVYNMCSIIYLHIFNWIVKCIYTYHTFTLPNIIQWGGIVFYVMVWRYSYMSSNLDSLYYIYSYIQLCMNHIFWSLVNFIQGFFIIQIWLCTYSTSFDTHIIAI